MVEDNKTITSIIKHSVTLHLPTGTFMEFLT